MERGYNGNSSVSSRERTTKRGPRSTRGAASVRSSRSQVGKSIRNTVGSNNQELANAALSTRVVIDGVDVTPRSLLFPDEDQLAIYKDTSSTTGSTTTSVSSSKVRGSTRRNNRSSMDSGGDRFSQQTQKSRGGKENQETAKESKKVEDFMSNMSLSPSLINTGLKENAVNRKNTVAGSGLNADSKSTQQPKKQKLTAKELNMLVELQLNETKTQTLLHIIGTCVGIDSLDHKTVTERNKVYEKCLEDRESHLDSFLDHQAQTFNLNLKEKEISVKPVEMHEMSCQAASWDIWDAQMEEESKLTSALGDMSKLSDDQLLRGKPDSKEQATTGSSVHKRVEEMVAISLATPGCLLPLDVVEGAKKAAKRPNSSKNANRNSEEEERPDEKNAEADEEEDGAQVLAKRETDSIMSSSALLSSLRTIERSIQQNNYHGKHLRYRAINAFMEKKAEDDSELEEDSQENVAQSGEQNELADLPEGRESLDQSNSVDSNEDVSPSDKPNASESNKEAVTGNGETSSDMPKESDPTVDVEERRLSKRRSMRGSRIAHRNSTASTTYSSAISERGIPHDNIVPPSLERLWQFKCPESAGRNVAAMAWNSSNPDLLAVAYGQFDFSQQRDGAILFWTLKNPEFPERVIKTTSGVCSLEFSKSHPSMLAVGMYNGNVAIYDLRPDEGPANEASAGGERSKAEGGSKPTESNAEGKDKPAQGTMRPILESSNASGSKGHTDAVWQVRWVEKRDGVHGRIQEVLVSISMDGRITEWSLKKGLTATDLMVLKRVNSPFRRGHAAREGIISRTAAGLCFDVPSDNPAIYFAATEDGTIHKCSVSYNEQYLETYFGHAGPVNKIHCSPFSPNVFLTCSADWTMRLWDAENTEAVSTLQAVDLSDVVHDVCWSPTSSTVFGSVTGDGRVEIWDLSQNTLDPVITKFIEPSRAIPGSTQKLYYSSIAFARNAPVVVVGDSHGTIDVFRLSGSGFGVATDEERESPAYIEEESSRLHEAMYPESFAANE